MAIAREGGDRLRLLKEALGEEVSYFEIRAVLAYIKSTWPPEIRERQRQISAR
mgnify:CR=1 FL=1